MKKNHDLNFTKFLQETQKNGLKIGADKIQYKLSTVNFYGTILTSEGYTLQNEKIEAIQNMQIPQNVKQLQSFLGLVNYLSRYSAKLADLRSPLQELLKDKTVFPWNPEHTETFNAIKNELSRPPILAYFDVKAPYTVLQTDASNTGSRSFVLLQGKNLHDLKPIMYGSRSLKGPENSYVAIEKEALAVAWSMERLHHFLHGKRFMLQTDHKPLETILIKSVNEASPRLQRLIVRTLAYSFDVQYIQGKKNVLADCTSRCMTSGDTGNNMVDLPKLNVHQTKDEIRATPTKLNETRIPVICC